MNAYSAASRTLLLLILSLLLFGCAAEPVQPESFPLTDEEIEFLKKLDDPEHFSVKEDVPTLFFRLNQLIKSWQESSLIKDSKKHLRIYTNIGAILTRRVYMNFDKILDQLENGSQPNKVIAASALGFSRIPDQERFPQVYPRAIQALLRALDSGDDAIIQNALMSLTVLGDPATPLDPILPLMTQHHNPDVRSNAALCLAALVTPDERDLVTPYVLPALKDDEPKVRNHAINIILAMKDEDAVPQLIEMMSDRYELIRANAARTLGELGNMRACPVLIKNLSSPKDIVKIHCLDALKKLSGEDYEFEQEKWRSWWEDYNPQQPIP